MNAERPGPAADLHLHTTASDGTDDLETRIEQARDRRLTAIAITDHDVIADGMTTRRTHEDELEVITGVEVRADLFGTKIELLGYYVDPTDRPLKSLLEQVREYRHDRNRAMIARLEEATGERFEYDELRTEATGVVGRPHLASTLVERGVVEGVGEAFERYLGDGGVAFVAMEREPAADVIETIHDAGGVTSLAHPGRIRSERVPEMIDHLIEAGLDGIEVWYPYGEKGPDAYADIGVEEAAALATEHGLLRTGGSDCHGCGSGKFRIGSVGISVAGLNRVRERAAQRRPL